MNDAIPLPNDPRHQRFADLVLSGETPPEAYRKAGFSATSTQSRAAASCRLLKNVKIATYMAAVRGKAAQGAVLTLQQKREFLCRIVTTPLMSIDPKGKDGDLIRKYKSVQTETGGSEEIEKLDPLKAIDLDNKLTGEDAESGAMNSLSAALAALGPGGGAGDDRM